MRKSGVLMHITSLPSRYGIGTMGKKAYEFIDFLKAAGQSYWQILPLTPTGYGDSPYQSYSTFAGNHYLIDLDLLVEEGLLLEEEVIGIQWYNNPQKVDYGSLYNNRLKVLRKAFRRHGETEDFARFRRENDSWLPQFASYMVLKECFYGKPCYQWPHGFNRWSWQAMEKAVEYAGDEGFQFYCFVQYLFFKQWALLRAYAHENGVEFIGDVPIYVPLDSADVWTDPHLFQLDENLLPTAVAGCPPDAFTEDGQLWGNPLYRWELMKEDGYSWWLNRMEAAGRMYDVIRLDHFRGFESYWSVPYGDPTARDGKWVKGPGMDFINAIKEELPNLKLIAEDLGFLTQEVLDLRDQSGFPGMKVLGFAFDSREPSDYLPYGYIANTVCYTGTHDNMTTRQWFDTASEDAVAYAKEYMHLDEKEGLVWGVIRTAMSSVSDLCVVPMQDYLDLGGESRMNFPGTMTDSNWTWRVNDGIITNILAKRIYNLTNLYGRLGNQHKTYAMQPEI